MAFTPLHRALGIGPGSLTDEILDAAVAAGVTETDELDWKSKLPPANGLPQTDFPKDVAAMANGAGGVIVFGVLEEQKAAVRRVDAGEFDEALERSLRSAAITAISPPVFGLKVHRLGSEGNCAVVVDIPAGIDGPHLIYRNQYFGAPLRNDADTVWMKERQIEAMYRARFEERRHATEALDALFEEASLRRGYDGRAWIVAVAHPRVVRFGRRLTRQAAHEVLEAAADLALQYADRSGIHPLESVDRLNPRPGLRRWVGVNTATADQSVWRESWVSIHHDGSVTLAAAVGGHPISSNESLEGWQIESTAIECAIADFMGLLRATAEETDNDEYDLRVGIAWSGEQDLMILTKDNFGHTYDGVSTPLRRYTPVETTVDTTQAPADFNDDVRDLALDCLNQGGISNLLIIRSADHDQQQT